MRSRPSRPPTWSPPAHEGRYRFPQAVAARAAARELSRPPPRAECPARAQCTHCAARHRRPPPSRPPTGSPPALEHRPRFSPRRRRAGRRPRTVATVAPRGTPIQSAMHALRSSTSGAATVAAPGLATASARMPPPVFPTPSPRGPSPASRRDRRPARNIQPGRNARIAQLDVGHRHRRGRRPGHRQRSNTAAGFPQALAARAAACELSRPPPRADRPARAQCTQCVTRRRPPPPSRRPPWPPPALDHHHRFARAVAAMGRRATSGARRPIAEHPARCAARAAHDHRWWPPPSRPKPGTAPPPTAFSILLAPSHRRAVYRIRAPGQVSHITTGPRASSVFHNQHRCGKRRAADALAMSIHRSVGPDPWICGKPAWHNHRPRSEFST